MPIVIATISILFHEVEQITEEQATKVGGCTRAIAERGTMGGGSTRVIRVQDIAGGGRTTEGWIHTKAEPDMAQKSIQEVGEWNNEQKMRRARKEVYKDQHADEVMDPYYCFVEKEHPALQASNTEITQEAGGDMEEYRCFIVEEHPPSLPWS